MEKLNKSGRALLEYRSEFRKHYSDSIDESLKEAISTIYQEKKIDEKIFRNIFNEDITDEDFEIMLSKRKEFTKNTTELNYEFDLVRKKINEYMIEIGFTNSMNTKNSLDINKIIIIHQFDLNRNYIMSSFGVNQTEIIPLMKRRGFVEKFAVLRLNQVLKEIYGEVKMPEDVDHGYSLVYYNKKTLSFSIDYKFYVNVDIMADEKRMKDIVNKIKELDRIIDKKFHSKLGNEYFEEPKNNASSLRLSNAEKPNVKQIPIQPPHNIVNKAQKTPEKEIPKPSVIAEVEVEDKIEKQDNASKANAPQTSKPETPKEDVKQEQKVETKPVQQNQPKTDKQPTKNNQQQKKQEQPKRPNNNVKKAEIIVEKEKPEIVIDDDVSDTKKPDIVIDDNKITVEKENKDKKDDKKDSKKDAKKENPFEEIEIEFDVSDKDLL